MEGEKVTSYSAYKEEHVLGTPRQDEESDSSAVVETRQENEGQHKGFL